MFSQPAPDEFTYKRVVHEGRKRISDTETQLEFHAEQAISEADVVLRILNLTAASELNRLRQCESCSKWFYAERSHQKFCPGGECRVAEYSKSPKYKNYRKLYMRRVRAEAAHKSAKPTVKKGI
jgi:predicted RNA-binding Zn ribbon-like protein